MFIPEESHSLSCLKKGELVPCPLWSLSSAHLQVLLGPWACRHKARVVVGWQVTVIPSHDSSDLGGTGAVYFLDDCLYP